MAMVGASDPEGKPSGFMSQGMCIPLAATSEVREAIEDLGEDSVADWIDACDVDSPKAGGLWVAEVEFAADPDGPQGYRIDSCAWRPPTTEEIEGLIGRQMARARGVKRRSGPRRSVWTFIGALC